MVNGDKNSIDWRALKRSKRKTGTVGRGMAPVFLARTLIIRLVYGRNERTYAGYFHLPTHQHRVPISRHFSCGELSGSQSARDHQLCPSPQTRQPHASPLRWGWQCCLNHLADSCLPTGRGRNSCNQDRQYQLGISVGFRGTGQRKLCLRRLTDNEVSTSCGARSSQTTVAGVLWALDIKS